jgi:hypothetical protein
MWCSLNNLNLKVEKNGDFYTVSFPTLGKSVPVMSRPCQQKWLDRIIKGTAKQGTATLYKKKRKWFIFDFDESQGKKGMGMTSVSGIWRWKVLEPSPCSLKGTNVPIYTDAMPPGRGLEKPRS